MISEDLNKTKEAYYIIRCEKIKFINPKIVNGY